MPKAPTPRDLPCPCGRPGTFRQCCEPYITGVLIATEPETLMRSRYSAYAAGTAAAVEYLVSTHHPKHRDPALRSGVQQTIDSVDAWEQLQVVAAEAKGERGLVEFIATYRVGFQQQRLHERSQFLRENGRWFYTVGTLL